MKSVAIFVRTHKIFIISIGFLAIFSFAVAHATPPSSPYAAGVTLDPQCAPGDANCTVQASPWTISGNNTFYTAGNVGIGTTTPSSALEVNGQITATSLNVTGIGNSVPAPTNLQASIAYGSGVYTAHGNLINYRVYAYRIFNSSRIYSTPVTLTSDLVDDSSGNPYSVHLSWNPVAGATGYRIIFGHGTNDSNYQTGSYDTTSTTLVDDGCGTVCFNGPLTVTPLGTFSNTNTINGNTTTIGGNAIINNDLYVAGNITCGGTCGAAALWLPVVGGINYGGGNVGIGTTTPTKALSVNGDVTVGNIYFNDIANTNHYIFGDSTAQNIEIPGTNGSDKWIVNNQGGQGLAIDDSGTETQSFNSTTNLSKINLFGIQTLALDDTSQSNNFIRLGNTAQTFANNKGISVYISGGQGGNTGAQNGGDIKIDAGAAGSTGSIGNILLSTVTAGNVGIGTANPTSLLSVNGSFNATGDSIVLGNGTSSPQVDIIARGDMDGLKLYSLSNANGGSVNPPTIGFYRSLDNFVNTLPRFRIQGEAADGGDRDGFLFSSPASSVDWIGASVVGGFDLGINSSQNNIMNFFQQSYFTQGTVIIGNDPGSATPPTDGEIRSGQKNNAITPGLVDVRGSNLTVAAGGGDGASTQGGNIYFQTPDLAGSLSGLIQPTSIKMTLARSGDLGVGNLTPTFLLDVGSTSVTTGTAVAEFQNAGGTCDVTPSATGGITCSSDMNLKKNITNLSDGSTWNFNSNISINNQNVLQEVLALNPVDYNWNVEQDTDTKHAGFIAQEVQQVFPGLVTQNPSTHLLSLDYTGLVPYTVEAIKEMNVNIISIDDLTKTNTWRDALLAWFSDTSNGIQNFFSKKITTTQLCVSDANGQTCLTRAQVDQLLQNNSGSITVSDPTPPVVDESTTTQTPDTTPIVVPPADTQTPDTAPVS